MFKNSSIVRVPLRGTSDRETLGARLAPATQEQRFEQWKDRFKRDNPGWTEEDFLQAEARGLRVLASWRRNGLFDR